MTLHPKRPYICRPYKRAPVYCNITDFLAIVRCDFFTLIPLQSHYPTITVCLLIVSGEPKSGPRRRRRKTAAAASGRGGRANLSRSRRPSSGSSNSTSSSSRGAAAAASTSTRISRRRYAGCNYSVTMVVSDNS